MHAIHSTVIVVSAFYCFLSTAGSENTTEALGVSHKKEKLKQRTQNDEHTTYLKEHQREREQHIMCLDLHCPSFSGCSSVTHYQ